MTRYIMSAVGVTLALVACTSTDPERAQPGGHHAEDGSSSDDAPTEGTGAASSEGGAADATSGADSSPPGDGSDESSSDGTPACEGVCVSPPDGWHGPIVVRDDGSCDGSSYDEPQLDGYHELLAPEATCGCDCSVSDEASCSASLVRYTGASCASLSTTFALHDGCNNISDQTSSYFGLTLVAEGGACDADGTADVAPIEYLDATTLCGAAQNDATPCADGGTCFPTPDDGKVCWWTEGDVSCPHTGRSLLGSRDVIYTDEANDTRDCTACTCSDPEIDCSDPGVVMVTAGQSCNLSDFPAPVAISPDDCMQYAPHSVLMNGEPDATTTCGVAQASTPTGAAQPQGAVTICCEP